MLNSDSYLSTHSRPGARLVLSLLSFSLLGIKILKYLFIWMCDSIFAQLFSCVTLVELQQSRWLYASWEPDLTGVRKCSAHYKGENSRIFFLLCRHPHLRETDLVVADGRRYRYIGWPLLSNTLHNLPAITWGEIWGKGPKWRNKTCLSFLQASVRVVNFVSSLHITSVV